MLSTYSIRVTRSTNIAKRDRTSQELRRRSPIRFFAFPHPTKWLLPAPPHPSKSHHIHFVESVGHISNAHRCLRVATLVTKVQKCLQQVVVTVEEVVIVPGRTNCSTTRRPVVTVDEVVIVPGRTNCSTTRRPLPTCRQIGRQTFPYACTSNNDINGSNDMSRVHIPSLELQTDLAHYTDPNQPNNPTTHVLI